MNWMTWHNHQTQGAARPALWLTMLTATILAGCASAPEPESDTADKSGPPSSAPPVPDRNEVALQNGTQTVANTPTGKIMITAGPGLLRTVQWDGVQRWAVMKPRTERWAGSLGIHYEGKPPEWTPHKGLRKLEFEEGQRHFDNVDDAMIWLQIRRLHFVHTSDGLVVGWKRLNAESTLQVEIWQFYIDGDKPSRLPKSKDHLVKQRQAPVRAADNR